MWILGDNFVAETFRPHFKLASYNSFLKENFNLSVYCSSKYTDKNTNTLSRLQNTIIAAMNKEVILPEYIVMVMSTDLIDYLGYIGYGVSSMYGIMLEWLVKSFDDAIQQRIKDLPKKSKWDNGTTVYWAEIPVHADMQHNERLAYVKFNNCLQSIVKLYNYMRIVKLKEHWQYDNNRLFSNGRMTTQGKTTYWKAIDAAVKFNYNKRKIYLAKELLKSSTNCNNAGQNKCEKKTNKQTQKKNNDMDRDITRFFQRRRENRTNRSPRQKKFDRFLLPKPKY